MRRNIIIVFLSFVAIFFSLLGFATLISKFKKAEEILNIAIENDASNGYISQDTYQDNQQDVNNDNFVYTSSSNFPEISSGIEYQKPKNIRYVVKPGDTIEKILNNLEIEKNFAFNFISNIKKSKSNILRINIGQELNFEIAEIGYDPDIKKIENNIIGPQKKISSNKFEIISFATKIDNQKYIFFKTKDEGFSFTVDKIETIRKIRTVEGVIKNSLFTDTFRANIPSEIVIALIDMYSFDIDFQRDIRYGDRFLVEFEEFYDLVGNKVKNGKILYSTILLQSKTNLEFFYFDKFNDFFDADGKSFKKGLMKTPINGARLSSTFGYRRHPILGYTKLHKGIDFAAPKGTPIFAAGGGRIEFKGRHGGYGNYIRIRHNDTYSTAYAHMSRFARHARGSFVKQGEIIGYVGTTGRSTGNHLHYEIMKNGIQVNPSSIKAKSNKILKGKDLTEFYDKMQIVKTKIKKEGFLSNNLKDEDVLDYIEYDKEPVNNVSNSDNKNENTK